MASVDTIVTTDRDHVWHPYSPIPGPTQHIVTAAEGPYLTLDIDARFLHAFLPVSYTHLTLPTKA